MTTETTMMLPAVTIRLDAAYDLRAAGLPTSEAAALLRAYREAAMMICDGVAEVTVAAVDGGADAGCDAAWAEDFGLWQTAHGCCVREDDEWGVDLTAATAANRNLKAWRSRVGT